MEILADTMDDALYTCLKRLSTSNKARSLSSTKGDNRELVGVQVRISNPRARFSRAISRSQLFSSLGELVWYWSGSDRLDHIAYYISKYKAESEDGEIVPGAYGPRLFRMRGVNQIQEIVSLLRDKPSTRRAVVQLYDAGDIGGNLSPPCTCTLQFLNRQNRLVLIVSMRSNDALFGFPHDVFAFTMIQEIVSRIIGVEVGEYIHSVGSLHLYANQKNKALSYLKEGYQEKIPMPPMPEGNPLPSLHSLLEFEARLRAEPAIPELPNNLPEYWLDIAKLLAIYGCYKRKDRATLETLKSSMGASVYERAITKRASEVPWKAKQEAMDF